MLNNKMTSHRTKDVINAKNLFLAQNHQNARYNKDAIL